MGAQPTLLAASCCTRLTSSLHEAHEPVPGHGVTPQAHLEQIKVQCLWLQLLGYEPLQQLAQQRPLAFPNQWLLANDLCYHHLLQSLASQTPALSPPAEQILHQFN